MEELGILKVEVSRSYRNPLGEMKQEEKRVVLSQEQEKIVEQVWQDFSKDQYHTYLLYGVTGSGKTAVYIELIEEGDSIRKAGKSY